MVMSPSPVVALNRAVALGMAVGPVARLEALDEIDSLDTCHLFHAARAEMLLRLGDNAGAAEAFRCAHDLALGPAERRHERRIAASSES